MTSQLLDKTCEEIITIAADLDDSSKRLIDWHMKIIYAMDHEIALIPDVITRAIDNIDMEANSSTEDLQPVSKGLAGFVHSLYFFAKAKYQSIVNKSRQAATQLLEQSVYLLINNLETLVSSAVQGAAALFTTLRQIFAGDKQWIKNLIKFFTSKINAKQAEEEFINFVDRILQKISRQRALMRGTIIYRELVFDHYDELIARKEKLLREKYPDQIAMRKIYSRAAAFINLFLLTFSLIIIQSSPGFGVILFLISVSWMIYQMFCFVSYLLASRKREKLRGKDLEKYKDWLDTIKQKETGELII